APVLHTRLGHATTLLRGCDSGPGERGCAPPDPGISYASCANRNSVVETLSIDRVHVRSACPVGSSVSDWKSSNSRLPLHPVPPVQIWPVFTTAGSTVTGVVHVPLTRSR